MGKEADSPHFFYPNIYSYKINTKAKPYKGEKLDYNDFLKEKYIRVNTEKSGLLPISKYIRKTSSGKFEKNNEDYTPISSGIEPKYIIINE